MTRFQTNRLDIRGLMVVILSCLIIGQSLGMAGWPEDDFYNMKGQKIGSRPVKVDLHEGAKHGDSHGLTWVLTYARVRALANNLDPDGWTPLHHAAANGHTGAARALAPYSDLSARTGSNYATSTALHLAINRGHVETARYLITQTTNLEEKDGVGMTPLMRAANSGNEMIVEYLIEAGALVNAANRSGETALHIAARNDNSAVVRLLVDAGADVEAKDRQGRIPRDLASSSTVKMILPRKVEYLSVGEDGFICQSHSGRDRRIYQKPDESHGFHLASVTESSSSASSSQGQDRRREQERHLDRYITDYMNNMMARYNVSSDDGFRFPDYDDLSTRLFGQAGLGKGSRK